MQAETAHPKPRGRAQPLLLHSAYTRVALALQTQRDSSG